MRLNHRLLLAACAAFLTGCSTSSSEFEQDVTFTANVDRAMVEIDGTRVGRTPIRVALDRTRNHRVVIGKSGYKPHEAVLRPTLQGGDYGFTENIKINLDVASDAPNDVPEEDLAEFNRAKSMADAPLGADPATYGTLAGDLVEAKQAAERLAAAAAAAKRGVETAEQNLAKAVAAAKAETEKGSGEAVKRLENTEQALRNALAETEKNAQQAEKAREVVTARIKFLESLQGKADTTPTQTNEAAEALAEAKREAATAETKAAASQNALAEATAALKAATEARTKTGTDSSSARLESLGKASEMSRTNAAAFAAKIEAASRVVAARVEELSRQVAEEKSGRSETVAALEAARKENAELAAELAAVKLANAKATAEDAEKALAEANERAAALERQLAESRLAIEAKLRENRARAYAEYTARKGLLERALRTGELNKDTYQEALEALDKELRNR